ncbi:hypothetical protein VTJ04DRAFT_1369 [Mycothermus thermophilus]|uniref:uncharacterized protein n=1 Tax=Humicola insolens TaxID=85995 RepID=UPI003743A2BA
MTDREGHDLPIPTIERNDGSDPQVYDPHHHQYYGQHTWPKTPAPTSHYNSEYGHFQQSDPGPPATEPEKRLERRIFGIQTPIFVLSCFLFMVIVALATASTILGLKVSRLETTVGPLEVLATSTPGPSIISTTSSDEPNTSEAFVFPLVPVTNARYVGCYWYALSLVLVDTGGERQNMTNEMCAGECREKKPDLRHFGTWYGKVCNCLTLSEKAQRAPDWTCWDRCGGTMGKQPEYCGGPWSLSVWERTDMD